MTKQTVTDDLVIKQNEENKLKAGLTLHLDTERAFKLYSFRIINTNTFNQLIEESLELYYNTVVKGQKANDEEAQQNEE